MRRWDAHGSSRDWQPGRGNWLNQQVRGKNVIITDSRQTFRRERGVLADKNKCTVKVFHLLALQQPATTTC